MRGDLFLTDGTTRINLLTGIDGFYLQSWNPAIPGRKATFRDSPLTDGRKPALMRWSNATETMSFHVARFTQNDVIHDTQDLRRLLLAAEEYFLGGSDVPVWLEARGDCETNTRYAVIVTWGTGSDSDPYNKPFDFDHPAMSPWTLTLERQHWRHLPPGQSECVELSATQDYYAEQNDDFAPNESADDCWIEDAGGGSISLNTPLQIGSAAAPPGSSLSTGVRFRTVAIPQGADIINAWIAFQADANLAANTVNVTIAGDDVDNSAIFSTYADFTGRARTTATVAWSAIGAWAINNFYNTPNIAAAIQEVIDRAGWVSGNSLSVLLDDNASTAGATRTAYDWDSAIGTQPILYVYWFDSHTRTFGRTATCNNEVYVANKHNIAQLTHIFVDDGGVFGANLIGAALPFDFLPAVPAANDAVYFGVATAAPNSGPFCSLVFDILDAQNDLTTVSWQYWNGAWVALSELQDNTNANGFMTGDAFDTTGINSVHWAQDSDWATTTVNGVLGYWVRALVGAIGAAPDAPSQQNRDIYTIVTPYVDTTAANVVGDIQALAKHYLYAQAGHSAGSSVLSTGRVYAALRSYDRGSDFTAYINLADEQNNANITIGAVGGYPAVFANDTLSPTGRAINITTVGAVGMSAAANVQIASPLANDYVGEYRAFMRLRRTAGAATEIIFMLVIREWGTGNAIWVSRRVSPSTTAGTTFIDYGKMSLPGFQHDLGQTLVGIALDIYAQTTAAVNWNLYDLILMPCDECFFETRVIPDVITGSISASSLIQITPSIRNLYGVMDSTIPRRFVKTSLNNYTGDTYIPWTNNANTPIIYQPNEHQKWWFFFDRFALALPRGRPELAHSVQSFQVSRYLSMRGAR